MPVFQEIAFPASVGFVVTLMVSVLIVLTQRWHGMVTFDVMTGPQKFHEKFTPRIGGLAVFTGLWAAASMTVPPTRELLFAFGVSSIFAFVAGLAEDLTKRVSTTLRLLSTILSGLGFCMLTGYSVSRIEIPILDIVMELSVVSVTFTIFAIAALTHAINIVDGFHGLATGSVIIMLCAFMIVASMVGDHNLVLISVVIIAVLASFLLVNFPFGHVFLGDGGAYLCGLLLAYVSVMLPERNHDVSPWVSVVVLAYPLLEIGFSIFRKTFRYGHRPSEPDKLHLHMLVYRSFARKIAKSLGSKRLANPTNGVLMWGGPITSLVAVSMIPPSRAWSLLVLSMQSVLYGLIYRRTSLQRRGRVL